MQNDKTHPQMEQDMNQQIFSEDLQSKASLTKPYSKGPYNKSNDQEQWIRITEGCPNQCEYCRESFENGIKPIYYPIPNIIRNDVKIIDMNLMYKSKAIEILDELGSKRVNKKVVYYELVCGIDYRYMTQEKADALKRNRFKKIRLAWDHNIIEQRRIKSCIKMLNKAGYRGRDIMVFMICNWKISYQDNLFKLDLCKVWGVFVCACWFDNQAGRKIKPIHWIPEHIKEFNRKERKHNQMINFGIDPQLKNCT